MPSFILKLWNREEIEKEEAEEEEEAAEDEPLVLLQILFFVGLHCKAPQYNKPTRYSMAAQLKLRYSQEELKKAQRGLDWQNRCFGSRKALVPW